MTGVLSGFLTIAVVVALGMVLARGRVLDEPGLRTLQSVAFFLASPALLFTVLQDSEVSDLFSGNLLAIVGGVLATLVGTLAVCRVQGRDTGSTVVAAMCSSYCNAGNLGIPIAFYVLGDTALVAPVLLLQLVVLQPLALTILDVTVSPEPLPLANVLTRPLRNPITIASLAGVVVALLEVDVPDLVVDPLELVGGLAVPAMLLAYGASLWLGPLPGRGVALPDLGVAVGLKLLVQPLAAYAVGRALGLGPDALLAITVISALPTAQNVYVIATRYGRAELLARDAIFVSTLGCVPVVTVIVALLA
ncbi:AEC family transporter [Nocardioides plantarum]|uniref:AEC family transporter n=1 Tax=Nocardioides plantarum TaxID=29299 RepID=A0ABV5KGZ6_9ACTN|nr:AEC family transporter [Nocardioides plantarum]